MDESEESNDNNSNVVDLNMSSADRPICILDTSDEEDSDDEEKEQFMKKRGVIFKKYLMTILP
jgi:hypothetical protein